jgi:sugar phosphate isomerase/epimerase
MAHRFSSASARRTVVVGLMFAGAALAGCGPRHPMATRETPAVGTSASFSGPVGLQLWSLRGVLDKDVPAGLEYARQFGFVEVELAGTYGLSPSEFRVQLDRHGLKAVSGHWPFEAFEKTPETVAREAEELGVSYAGCAWLADQGPFDEALCRRAAKVFNQAGQVLASHHIQFFYHNHGYEFVPYGDGTLFDLLMKETRPDLVGHEMDVFWTVHAGQDPVALLQKYPGRWRLFHIKDMKKGVRTGNLTGSEDETNDVVVGTGQIDIAKTLRAAQQAGVKHFFLEDESPSAIQQIPQSHRFLESLSW